MAQKPTVISNFSGGLNLTQSTAIENSQFTKLYNFFYNKDKQLETRRGYKTFANQIGSAPITSIFGFQRDDTLARKVVCNSGTVFYEYDEGTDAWVSKQTGLTEFETIAEKTTHRTRWDYTVYKNVIYMANGVDDYADRDGTTYNQYAAEPNVRYVSMLTDRIFSAGDDTNPNSLYYTDAAPADGTNINQNTVVIGGDENGRINSISELGNIILAGKSNKVYTVDVTTPSALPIDAQSGMYCDRTIANVGNSLVYFSDRGVDTLKQRSGVSGSSALEGEPLGDDIRQLTSKTEPFQYNSGAARYIKPLNNYYYAFDTDDDNVPDTVLVYSSAVQSWTQYNLPNLYDFGEYIDSDQSINYLFTSANGGQAYQFETGFDDNGIAIDYELETKEFDMGTPGLNKTFDYVDVVGLKSEGAEIDVKLKVDSEEITESPITDANIDLSSVAKVLGETPLGTSTLTGASSDTDVDMYRFTFRCPCYATGDRISVNMSSTGGVWILEQMRISRDDEPIEVYAIDNIG